MHKKRHLYSNIDMILRHCVFVAGGCDDLIQPLPSTPIKGVGNLRTSLPCFAEIRPVGQPKSQLYQSDVTPSIPSLPSVTPSTPSQPSVTPTTPSRPSVTPSTPSLPSFTPSIPSLTSVTPATPSWPSVTPSAPCQPSVTPCTPSLPSVTPSTTSQSGSTILPVSSQLLPLESLQNDIFLFKCSALAGALSVIIRCHSVCLCGCLDVWMSVSPVQRKQNGCVVSNGIQNDQ
jgi:hypothetical protein